MSEKTFNNIRQTQLTDTSERWSQKDFIPMKGELVVIQEKGSKSSQIKVGDGENPLSQLSSISGSGGSGVGQLTAECGEIFNDYENNKVVE